MVPGLELATRLVMEICGGTPSDNVVVGKTHGDDHLIDFPVSEVKRLAGIDVPMAEMRLILNRLGFMMAGSGPVVKVAIPSWRSDVQGKADIVEEIVRIVGIDKVPETPFERGEDARKPVLTPIQLRTRRAKRALAARGMVEAVTWSFIAKPYAELFDRDPPVQAQANRRGHPELSLANPIAADMSDMRPSLLPGLVDRGTGQYRSRFFGFGLVRSRAGLHRRPSGRRADRGGRRSSRLRVVAGHRAALVRFGACRCA